MFEHQPIELGYDDIEATTTTAGRVYRTPTGKDYPSITTVLSHLGAEKLAQWRKNVGEEAANEVSRRASTRGTWVHSLMESYIKNEEIDTKSMMSLHRKTFFGLKKILDQRLSVVYGQELPLYSDYLGVAGRVDLIGKFDGVPSIVDFKTSRRLKEKSEITSYFLQTCAYAIMFEERTGLAIPNLVIVMDIDSSEPIVFKEHRDNWDKELKAAIAEHHRLQRCRVL